MKIKFNNLEILSKNSKRLLESINKLEINNESFISIQNKLSLTKIKDVLAISYGYTSVHELIRNHHDKNVDYGISLEDLSYDDKISLDKNMFEKLFNLLLENKVDEQISAVVSASCVDYLNKKLKKPQLKHNKKIKYKSYTEIGKLYNCSMQKAKSIINKGVYLNNHFPTYKAIKEGKCMIKYFETESYGNKPKYLWEMNYIKSVFSRNKVKKPTGYSKFSYGKSPYYIEKNIENLVECLIKTLPVSIREEYKEKYEFYGFDPFIVVEASYYTGVDWKSFIYSSFDDLIIEADKHNPVEVAKIEKIIDLNIDWLNKNRP
jgi:hypothetical protein